MGNGRSSRWGLTISADRVIVKRESTCIQSIMLITATKPLTSRHLCEIRLRESIAHCSGQCTFGIAYDLELPSTSLFLSTRVLSALLLVLALIGALTLALLFYLVVAAQCSSGAFRPPHRVFLRCFFSATPNRTDSETARVERKAQFENGLSKTKSEEKGREGRERMKGSVRMKDTFQSWMFWGVWPISISAVIGIYAWKEAVDAEEHLAYEM